MALDPRSAPSNAAMFGNATVASRLQSLHMCNIDAARKSRSRGNGQLVREFADAAFCCGFACSARALSHFLRRRRCRHRRACDRRHFLLPYFLVLPRSLPDERATLLLIAVNFAFIMLLFGLIVLEGLRIYKSRKGTEGGVAPARAHHRNVLARGGNSGNPRGGDRLGNPGAWARPLVRAAHQGDCLFLALDCRCLCAAECAQPAGHDREHGGSTGPGAHPLQSRPVRLS